MPRVEIYPRWTVDLPFTVSHRTEDTGKEPVAHEPNSGYPLSVPPRRDYIPAHLQGPANMELIVHERMQTSGPGWVVMYIADFNTVPTTVDVTAFVESTIPTDADPVLANLACKYIAEAFTNVLKPLGLSATVAIRDF